MLIYYTGWLVAIKMVAMNRLYYWYDGYDSHSGMCDVVEPSTQHGPWIFHTFLTIVISIIWISNSIMEKKPERNRNIQTFVRI